VNYEDWLVGNYSTASEILQLNKRLEQLLFKDVQPWMFYGSGTHAEAAAAPPRSIADESTMTSVRRRRSSYCSSSSRRTSWMRSCFCMTRPIPSRGVLAPTPSASILLLVPSGELLPQTPTGFFALKQALHQQLKVLVVVLDDDRQTRITFQSEPGKATELHLPDPISQ
jgi:hypothetical protein